MDVFGGRGRNRTFNLSIKSRMLCQLSYASGESRDRRTIHRAGDLHTIHFENISWGTDFRGSVRAQLNMSWISENRVIAPQLGL